MGQKRAAEDAKVESAKAAKTEDFKEKYARMKAEVLADMDRDSMLRELFDTWDKDGSGEITFDEVLPHYMRAKNQQDVTESKVKEGFESFMKREERPVDGGINLPLFKRWLGKLSDEQVAGQYLINVKGLTEKPYKFNCVQALDKEYETASLKEILGAPVSALQGLSDTAAEALKEMGVATVRDLGSWKVFLLARAICNLADRESLSEGDRVFKMNIKAALDAGVQASSMKSLVDMPVSVLSICPDQATEALAKQRIRTISQLANRKYIIWANAFVELEKYEL
eukprot:TRINITY_DN45756_c0_g1_i1.p1 TRINITY_DN45756_c0_g1~~TRINITY_DN45756_c0_g1_i1.p1  ORF type:complete len:283 (+),score=92.33 TRINITY_DN45756_c0_g1_i1:91-939(+)